MSNKKRMLICLVLTLALLCGLASVGCGEAGEGWEKIIDDDSLSLSMFMFKKNRNVPLDELELYDFNKFTSSTFRGTTVTWSGGQFYELGGLNYSHPVEHLIKLDSSTVCAVTRFELNGIEAYQYMLFERRSLDAGDGEEFECWYRTGEFYFLSKCLSSSDFDKITEGSGAAEIAAIDGAVAYDLTYGDYFDSRGGISDFVSYRLLTDGVMVIKLQAVDYSLNQYDLNRYEVTEKTFYPYDRRDEMLDFDDDNMMDITVLDDADILDSFE